MVFELVKALIIFTGGVCFKEQKTRKYYQNALKTSGFCAIVQNLLNCLHERHHLKNYLALSHNETLLFQCVS